MSQAQIYIGPAGWSYPDWTGPVYPPRKPKGFDPLEFISSYFNLIEINSTFYRVPAQETTRNWAERVSGNSDFRFTLKAHQDFTHSRGAPDRDAVEAFKRSIAPIVEADRLACVLLQYPWSFKNTDSNRRRLDKTIEWFRPCPVAVELRHGGWGRGDAMDALAGAGAAVCAVDQPAIGDSLSYREHRTGEAGAYIRLHGRNKREWFKPGTNRDLRYDYLYSPGELAPLTESVRKAAEAARQVIVVLNNHFRGQAVANALELKSALAGDKIPVPKQLVEAYPRLRPISLPDPNAGYEEGWLFDPGGSASENHE
jgi:uncharacterized protein YecE (DUF72 family)